MSCLINLPSKLSDIFPGMLFPSAGFPSRIFRSRFPNLHPLHLQVFTSHRGQLFAAVHNEVPPQAFRSSNLRKTTAVWIRMRHHVNSLTQTQTSAFSYKWILVRYFAPIHLSKFETFLVLNIEFVEIYKFLIFVNNVISVD